jgi:hypothetical protein
MEHKGIPYRIVQTACPTGFKWTVELDTNWIKTGFSFSKGRAVLSAIRAIDLSLEARRRRPRSTPENDPETSI